MPRKTVYLILFLKRSPKHEENNYTIDEEGDDDHNLDRCENEIQVLILLHRHHVIYYSVQLIIKDLLCNQYPDSRQLLPKPFAAQGEGKT